MFKKSCIAILCALLCLCCGCTQSPSEWKYYTCGNKTVFGNGITFSAVVRGGKEQKAIDEMYALLDDVNSEMSLSLSSGAISRFNALGQDGEVNFPYQSERVEISHSAYEIIQKSVTYYEDTNGLFNIAVYPLTKLWHADTEGLHEYSYGNPEDSPAPPDIQQVQAAQQHCNLDNLQLYAQDGKYYIAKTDPYLQIDLGAIAKGYAADACIAIAKANGVQSAMINISGNICVMGEWYHPTQKKYTRWDLGILAPRPKLGLGGNVCALSVPADRTLVTSGDYVRYYETLYNDEVLCVPHIIDGTTGLPLGVGYDEQSGYYAATSHIISATVICSDSAKADAYATAVSLMNADAAAAFLQERDMRGVLITQDKRMLLIGVTQSNQTGEEYFVYTDEYNGYKQYAIEEISIG